jgi:hypothetical protein
LLFWQVFRELFQEIDQDQTGSIDKVEFRFLLRTLRLTYSEDRFNRLFRAVDSSGEGTLSWSELYTLLFPNEEVPSLYSSSHSAAEHTSTLNKSGFDNSTVVITSMSTTAVPAPSSINTTTGPGERSITHPKAAGISFIAQLDAVADDRPDHTHAHSRTHQHQHHEQPQQNHDHSQQEQGPLSLPAVTDFTPAAVVGTDKPPVVIGDEVEKATVSPTLVVEETSVAALTVRKAESPN